MKIARNIAELIGSTPLLNVSRLTEKLGLDATILVKLELFNAGGSVKDRVAKQMLDSAERKGLITTGSTIIEPTSGNTGVGLALVGLTRGYNVIIVMPDSMSVERCKLIKALGARLELTPASLGMKGAIERAEQLRAQIPGSIIASQFDNPANPIAHLKTTGPEIWNDTDGKIDAFVAGVGTGGTVSGVGEYLKSKNSNIKIFAVEPFESQVLAGKPAAPHGIQGIGANFRPENFKPEFVDEILPVPTEEAIKTSRLLARTEGVIAGISSGAALYAATLVAKRPEFKNKTIVALLPDTGERYYSTALFE